MSRRPSKRWLWLLLPISAAAYLLGATVFYYPGSYDPPPDAGVPAELITLPAFESRRHVEAPVARRGMLLLENAHANAFSPDELDSLVSKVTARGYTVEFVLRRDVTFPGPGNTALSKLDKKLHKARSLAIVLPAIPFTPEELDVIEGFMNKGGRLLLIGDPGRGNVINSVADRFGLLFQDGYLYNVVEHVFNFRNIILKDFRPDQLTEGLETVALFNAGSIESTGRPLAFADTDTFSSMVERVQPFSPIVKSADGSILAISDLTFMLPPQDSTLDNDRLISNIADFVTTGDRTFDLSDFPHFFGDQVDILVGSSGLFDLGSRLKSMLAEAQLQSDVRGVEDLSKDTLFVGLYQDSSDVAQYLDAAGVQVGSALRTPFTPDIDPEGTAIALLHKGRDRHVMVILGDSGRAVARLTGMLDSGAFRDGLVGSHLGVYSLP